MFPDNLVPACSQNVTTVYKKHLIENILNSSVYEDKMNQSGFLTNLTNTIHKTLEEKFIKELKYTDGTNIIGSD